MVEIAFQCRNRKQVSMWTFKVVYVSRISFKKEQSL